MDVKDATPAEEPGVRSVVRALDLLALFTEETSRWSVRELVDASGLAKTTTLRLVATLERRGLLWATGYGEYSVGPGLLRWSRLARSAWQLPEPARQILRDLARHCGETVNVYVRTDIHRVCVAQEEGPQNLRHVVRVGDELPLWSGAASRVLLTDADDALLERISAAAPHEMTVADLRGRSAPVDEQGYAVTHGERELGASGLSAPVLDSANRVLAALGLGGPTPRFTDEKVTEFAWAVRRAADEVSRIGLVPGAPGERRDNSATRGRSSA